MKILAIRGKNMASLEDEFAVDFTAEPLASANIFAISGPTGAGKSSLLDTMCLALFARTPRTEQAKELNVRLRDISDDALVQSDPRFLLRRGTATGYAETDFVALNGHRYRARWSVSRAREKESGRLQSPRLTLFNIDKDAEEQGTRSDLQQKIIDLIGLTFEQFTRSVLLAQNDFSTFLKAEQGEKAALLEKLTGTELYSRISKRIFERNTEARTAYEVIQAKISGIELLPEETAAELRTKQKEYETLLKELEQARKEWEKRKEAVNNPSALLVKKEEEQKSAGEKLNNALSLRDKAKTALEEESKVLLSLEQTYKTLQPQLQEARKVDTELVNAKQLLQDYTTRLKEAEAGKNEVERKVQEISTSIRQSETEKTSIGEWFTKHKVKEKIALQLSTLLIYLDAAERTRVAIEKGKQELKTINTEAGNLAKQAETIQSSLSQKGEEINRLNEQFALLEKEANNVDTALIERQKETLLSDREQLLQEQLLFISVGSDAKELRERLVENKPCPVCGSLTHPYASKETHARMQEIQSQILSFTQQINTRDKLLKETAGKRKQADKLRELLLKSGKDFADTEKSRNEINNHLNILHNRLLQIQEINAGRETELHRSLESVNELFDNESWMDNWMTNPVVFRQKLTAFVSEWQTKERRTQELERLLSGYKAEQTSYSSFFKKHSNDLLIAANIFNKQDALCKTLQDKRKSLLEGKSAELVETGCQERIEQKKKQLEQLRQTLNEQSGIAEQARGQKEQIFKDLENLQITLANARKSQEEWLANYHTSSEGIMPRERWNKALEQKSTIDFRLQTHETNKKRITGLKEEAGRKQQVSEQWAKLNDLAGSADGSKFRRIAQSYTLDILLGYANVQLKSLTNRYRLERVPETLALQVVDNDMCDEIRTVHSLSGGESFLVSLALALGLSSLSSNRMKVESLFIDEGFGSLDAETLRIAMDALENLRTQGRKIGVISHVPEMTEHIPAQIRINRLGNGKSIIEII